MINDKEIKLLISILKEIDKHGISTFNSLNKKIAQSDTLELELISRLLPLRKTQQRKTKIDYAAKLEELTSELDEVKKPIFTDIISALLSRSSVKNLTELREFLGSVGIPTKKLHTRHEGVFLFVDECRDKEMAFLEQVRTDLSASSVEDRSLDGWSNLILKDREKP